MIPDAKLEPAMDRFAAIEAQLVLGNVQYIATLSKEHSDLGPIAHAVRAYRETCRQLKDSEAMLGDPQTDAEMKALAGDEAVELRARFAEQERTLQLLLLPKDSADESSAIVEVRAGTGGQEAALFAADLLKMYTRYSQLQGWKGELLSMSESDLGGVKEAVLAVEGQSAYAKLKFESGVHCVQRV